MARSLAELILEVKDMVKRTNDTTLITDTRVTNWLNDGQIEIVRRIPGLISLDTKDTTTLSLVTNQVAYSFASFSPKVAHLQRVYLLDNTTQTLPATGAVRLTDVTTVTITAHGFSAGKMVRIAGTTAATNTFNGTFEIATVPTANTFTYTQTDDADETSVAAGTATQIDGSSEIPLDFKPSDEFDNIYPEPAKWTAAQPTTWTRRGNNIEVGPPPSSSYAGKDLRVDHTAWAAVLSGTDSVAGRCVGTQTSTTMVDTDQTWTDDLYNDDYVYITGGTGIGQSRLITDTTGASTTIDVSPAWTTTPVASDSTYAIRSGLTETDIDDGDDGLIAYAVAKAWAAAGRERLSTIWNQRFETWLLTYKEANGAQMEWDGDVLFDD